MSRSIVRASIAAALALSLGACVVVPVDPRTGQPYPYPYPSANTEGGARTTVIMPPAPAAPPQ